ncbi:hypothetical protein HK100_005291 [Physocladia obscura]|uniref:Methyltransferase type 11 domain-containing protein n=1 Tax=Physocladia obscura TaxID=109957 RepID=A0AAD5SRY2_9FUNG|nr:hypothetical protein HK100_005291 [Physocladia obscura]
MGVQHSKVREPATENSNNNNEFSSITPTTNTNYVPVTTAAIAPRTILSRRPTTRNAQRNGNGNGNGTAITPVRFLLPTSTETATTPNTNNSSRNINNSIFPTTTTLDPPHHNQKKHKHKVGIKFTRFSAVFEVEPVAQSTASSSPVPSMHSATTYSAPPTPAPALAKAGPTVRVDPLHATSMPSYNAVAASASSLLSASSTVVNHRDVGADVDAANATNAPLRIYSPTFPQSVFEVAFNGDIVCPEVAQELLVNGRTDLKVLDAGDAAGWGADDNHDDGNLESDWLKCVRMTNPGAQFFTIDVSDLSYWVLTNANANTAGTVSSSVGSIIGNDSVPDNTFDFIRQRGLVLTILSTKEKFCSVLKEYIRVAKNGGWIELIEADIEFSNAGALDAQQQLKNSTVSMKTSPASIERTILLPVSSLPSVASWSPTLLAPSLSTAAVETPMMSSISSTVEQSPQSQTTIKDIFTTPTTALANFIKIHQKGITCYAAKNLLKNMKHYLNASAAVPDGSGTFIRNEKIKVFKMLCKNPSNCSVSSLEKATVVAINSKSGLATADTTIGEAKSVFLAMEDWMHVALGLSRTDYRALEQCGYFDWASKNTQMQVHVLYFQVVKK